MNPRAGRSRPRAGTGTAGRRFEWSVALALGLGLGLGAPALGVARAGLARASYAGDPLRSPAPDTGWIPATPVADVARVQTLAAEHLLRVMLGIALVLLALTLIDLVTLIAARSVQRRPEMAVRAALGGRRAILRRGLSAEAAPVVLRGVLLGLLLHVVVAMGIASSWPESTAPWGDRPLDPLGAAVAGAVLAAAAMIVWITPAGVANRTDLRRYLTTGRASTAGPGEALARRGLAVLQVGASVVLLTTAGVLARGEWSGTSATGVDPRGLRVTRVSLPPDMPTMERSRALQRIVAAAQGVGGVTDSSIATPGALVGVGAEVEVLAACAECSQGGLIKPVSEGTVFVQAVSPGFFATVGARSISGRELRDADGRPDRSAAVINAAFAYRLFPNGNPVGKLLRVGGPGGDSYTVVGVAEGMHAPAIGAGARPGPALYLSVQRHPPAVFDVVVRAPPGSAAQRAAIAGAIRRAAPASSVAESLPIASYLDAFAAPLRWLAGLFTALAGGALVLAASGLYAVVSEDVAQRTREIGVRMALGARGSDIRRLVLRRAFGIVLAGAVVGAIGASGLARLLDLLLGGVDPLDPLLFIAVTAVLTGVAAAAAHRPASRAAAVDPQLAIREAS